LPNNESCSLTNANSAWNCLNDSVDPLVELLLIGSVKSATIFLNSACLASNSFCKEVSFFSFWIKSSLCFALSTNFSSIAVAEALWKIADEITL
jgi:hypothetical protein